MIDCTVTIPRKNKMKLKVVYKDVSPKNLIVSTAK
jgi:hypothetical protein